ncbi:hypothetical protein MNBD_BACTEROID03-1279 [hydrothermal vent metagenome]|uniref:Outer membrane protein beta-barrel domain-containing protein n=1 Tax=hydrothermal vent metagenome TaxID=652676 RepID=A0A3B0TGY1_9ZZZZ
MRRICTYLFLFFLIVRTNAQDNSEIGLPTENTVGNHFFTESFSYPVFLNGETHSNFVLGYNFDKKFMAELQGFYDSYLMGDALKLSLRGKYYLKNNVYLFSGMEVESGFDKYSGKMIPARLYISNGMGYDFDKKMNFEAKHELQINKAGMGNYGMPNLFSLHGKYKF